MFSHLKIYSAGIGTSSIGKTLVHASKCALKQSYNYIVCHFL